MAVKTKSIGAKVPIRLLQEFEDIKAEMEEYGEKFTITDAVITGIRYKIAKAKQTLGKK
jgi:hypothetical protein